MNDEEIFHEALARDPADRAAYLDRACAGDPAVRASVEALLRAAAGASGFMARPAPGVTVDQPPAEGPGTVVGPYKLLEQIGEGGFGVVYMAEQTQPVRRKVALKVLKPGMDTRQVVARFEAERQALAIMDHPNIAKVLDGGATPSGRPYFVMELVKGVPITDFCDRNHLTPRQRLELFVSVCRAVQHAHQKGIIHRDLKPSNVLVTVHDTAPVVKVIDFGVAKAVGQELTDKTLFTGFAQMIGTPLYMSPEQAGQSGLDVDTRSDIYSLGVLLYELLTGTTPFDKDRFKEVAYDEIRRIIREEEPPKPSTRLSELSGAAAPRAAAGTRGVAPASNLASVAALRHTEPARLTRLVRGELDWIVMKALEKDRNRRYETATGFAADVQRHLADEPVQACPPSTWYRFRKFARRNKRAVVTATAAALVVVLAVAGLATSTALIARALKAETEAKGRLDDTLKRERMAAYIHSTTLAHRELSIDNLAAAQRALEDCPEDLRGWEWHYLMRLCRVNPLVIRDKTEVNAVAFSPDGEQLASAGGDGTLKIWNSRTGAVVHSFPAHEDAVISVAFHTGGRHLASRGADGKLKVWDLTATGEAVFIEPCDIVRKFGTSYTVAFSPDGRQLAAGTDGVVKVWDWKNRQLLHRLPAHAVPVAFSGDGRLATGASREDPKVWDARTGVLLRTVDAHRGQPVSALAFSPDGEWLASASFDRTVKLSNSKTGEILRSFDSHTGNVECVAFSNPDGRLLASGGEDKTVRVWDTTTGREVLALRGHADRVGCVAFSPDGRRLASASQDKTIRIWDATPLRGDEGQETLTFTQHSHEIRSVAFSPDGRRVVSAGSDGLPKVWDPQTGGVSAEFGDHVGFSGRKVVIFCAAWHPKGHLIASVGVDTVRVWDAQTKREVLGLPAAPGPTGAAYCAVAFSPDGRYLVTGAFSGAVQVWDAGTGREVGTLDTHSREVVGVVFSRDGEHLALASRGGIIKLWDAKRLDKERLDEKKEARLTLRARVAGPGLSAAFSPDGKRLVTGGEDNTVKIWDVETGRELLPPFRGHNGDVYTVAFSPDGRWVASAGEDSAVKVWDSHTGKLVHSFGGHKGLVTSLAFSPDGRLLVSGSRDKAVKVWDVSRLGEEPNRHPTEGQ